MTSQILRNRTVFIYKLLHFFPDEVFSRLWQLGIKVPIGNIGKDSHWLANYDLEPDQHIAIIRPKYFRHHWKRYFSTGYDSYCTCMTHLWLLASLELASTFQEPSKIVFFAKALILSLLEALFLYGQTRSEVKHHLIRRGHMTFWRIGSKNGEKNDSECLVLCPIRCFWFLFV